MPIWIKKIFRKQSLLTKKQSRLPLKNLHSLQSGIAYFENGNLDLAIAAFKKQRNLDQKKRKSIFLLMESHGNESMIHD
jgi:hypothetical protein